MGKTAKAKKQAKKTNDNQAGQTDNIYVNCCYEKIFPKMKLRNRVGLVLFIYIFLEVLFVFLCNRYSGILSGQSTYKMTAFIIGSALFWTCIITYNSKYFYKLYKQLRPLLNKNETDDNKWYKENAKRVYGMLNEGRKGVVIVTINVICNLAIIAVYYHLLMENIKANILFAGIVYVSLYLSVMCTILSCKSKNINIVLSIICCGLSYYVYLFKISDNLLPPLVNEKYIPQSLSVIGLVIILFFIAGTSIYPMYQSFKLFYLSNFEEKLIYPIEDLTVNSEKIYSIKKYFLQLTIASLIAYFQLFLSAYSLGIIRKESILTITLFIIVSFIPLIMFLASNIFFKNLCQKVRVRHIKETKLDDKILECVRNNNMDINKISGLLSIKEAYDKTILTENTINPEVLAAMLSPIVTTVLAVICKIKI